MIRRNVLLAVLALGGCDDGDSSAAPSPMDAAAIDMTPEPDASLDAGLDATLDAAPVDAMVDAAPADAQPDAAMDPGYDDPARWLCHPQFESDLCRAGLDATEIAPDGTLTPLPHTLAVDPPVDCFYVYPTTSLDAGSNSDFVPNADEQFVVHEQAGRFSRLCRVFAPVYRQVTVTGLLARNPDNWAFAYDDVVAAWEHYRAANPDRPVILIGHSQGASHLRQLMVERFDKEPEGRGLLVGAYLIGSSVGVPADAIIGGTFVNIPLCTSADEAGCIVSYATYRETDPPQAEALFGGPVADGQRSACVNPATLIGDPAALDGYFPTTAEGFFSRFIGETISPWTDPAGQPAIDTPHFTMPGLVSGACVARNGYDYLEITVNPDPADPRVDDIIGDLTTGWGLHLVDMHLVMGDLVRLAERQTEVWLAR